ncbi:alanine racemase [Methylocapsa sp. S129]|uniref:alanine racemase n=1 Tax=Methylocapsa sp. S129 TaxID=1641869 RepID=UPI00131D9C5D|nr:alanine racemase [Methylocapsa sp. S129]
MNAKTQRAAVSQTLVLDDRIRGVPPGVADLPIAAVAEQNWRPAAGLMSLPVLTLDEAAFAHNRDLMLRYTREQGVEIAPHGKTPMAPDLALSLIEAGAWGATVADIRQAAVMLRAGVTRLILANEVGGRGGAARLAALLKAWPQAEVYVFVDSVATAHAYAEAWRHEAAAPPLRVLVELGAGRSGARTLPAAAAILDAIVVEGTGRLVSAGVAAYEGSAAPGPEGVLPVIADLLRLTGELLAMVRKQVGPDQPLLVTAGGSVFFDKVVAALKPLVVADPAATLVLRSGAIFFHDHGVYERALLALDERGGFHLGGEKVAAATAFRPALRLWAEVLSRPEAGLAVVGMGMRDVSFDQGMPRPLRLHRNGILLREIEAGALKIEKLNDQHAFLSCGAGDDIQVGDVFEFGISHPCTCLDRYRVIFGVDASGQVRHAFPTFFG